MRPYILLTVDSLRSDCVTPDLLGNSLEILERDFATFTNAISYGVATPFAFPGILAGSHPVDNGMLQDNVMTIAEGIPSQSIGYSNNGHLREERGYARGFDNFTESPSLNGDSNETIIDYIVEELKKFDTIRNSEVASRIYRQYFRESLPQPSFPAENVGELVRQRLSESPDGLLWSHWMDPHTPYHPETGIGIPDELPSLEKLEDLHDRLIPGDASALTEEEIELARSLYDANVRYYDRHLSKLLKWMSKKPWYDEAFIAIVSDHGEYFGEHGYMFHTWDIDPHDEVIHTPLWVKYPDQVDGGKHFDHLVGHGDLLATMDTEFDEVEIDTPDHITPLRQETDRHIVSVSNVAKRLTEPDGIYIKRRDGTEEYSDDVTREGMQFLDRVEYPECVTSTGKALGVKEAERQRQLRDLGYR